MGFPEKKERSRNNLLRDNGKKKPKLDEKH